MGEPLELPPEQRRSQTPALARLHHCPSPAPICTLFWDKHQPSSIHLTNEYTDAVTFLCSGTFFFFFFKWQVLLSPVYIKIGLSALPLIPDPQVRDECWVTLRSILSNQGISLTGRLTWPLFMSLGNFFPSCCSPELRVSKLLSSSSYLLLLCPTVSFPKHPGAEEERKRPFPASKSYKMSWEKLAKDKQMGTRWKQSNPRDAKLEFYVSQSWPGGFLKKRKKKNSNQKTRINLSQPKWHWRKFTTIKTKTQLACCTRMHAVALDFWAGVAIFVPAAPQISPFPAQPQNLPLPKRHQPSRKEKTNSNWAPPKTYGNGVSLFPHALLFGKQSFRNQLSALND